MGFITLGVVSDYLLRSEDPDRRRGLLGRLGLEVFDLVDIKPEEGVSYYKVKVLVREAREGLQEPDCQVDILACLAVHPVCRQQLDVIFFCLVNDEPQVVINSNYQVVIDNKACERVNLQRRCSSNDAKPISDIYLFVAQEKLLVCHEKSQFLLENVH